MEEEERELECVAFGQLDPLEIFDSTVIDQFYDILIRSRTGKSTED